MTRNKVTAGETRRALGRTQEGGGRRGSKGRLKRRRRTPKSVPVTGGLPHLLLTPKGQRFVLLPGEQWLLWSKLVLSWTLLIKLGNSKLNHIINSVINNSKFYGGFKSAACWCRLIFGFYLENGIQAADANSRLLMWARVHLEQHQVLMN